MSNILTVNVVTYNHERYISKCLDSLLSQKTIFGYIIRIFDDCSTDGTVEICREYAEKYPDKIELHLSSVNLGIIKNPLRAYENINTKYYMYMEGDDYCCDDNKIQMQIDILESNPDCSFCCHDATLYYENEKVIDGTFPNLRAGIYTIEDIKNSALYLQSHLCSRIVRTDAISIDLSDPEKFLFDITQVYELFQKGNMFFIDKIMSVYRVSGNGIWNRRSLIDKYKTLFDVILTYNDSTDCVFEKNLLSNLQRQLWFSFYLKYELAGDLSNRVHMTECQNLKYSNKYTISLKDKIKKIKHYLIPPIILDIGNIPRDLSRKLRKKAGS